MYYLKSRYYDPETCRFINADAFVSTGQGIIGYNMFAYCRNEPVGRTDPTGHMPISSIAEELIRRTKELLAKQTGGAREYPGSTREYNDSYSCIGYALDQEKWINISNYVRGDALDITAENFMLTAQEYGCSIRPINEYYSPVNDNEYRVALRVGAEDYHVMRQNSDGTWSEKCGCLGRRNHNCYSPDECTWDLFKVKLYYDDYHRVKQADIIDIITNYYDSQTLYFAVNPNGG